MIKIERVLQNKRLTLALTGLTPKEFIELVPDFAKTLELDKQQRYRKDENRKRKPGGGSIGFLKTVEAKLFYALFYFKCYPTFDLLSGFYNCDRSNACRRQQYLTGILEKALGRKLALPKRQLRSIEEFHRLFPGVKNIFIDGTERPIRRPKNAERQKQNYSGKKKRHTRKNLVISDKKRKVGFLGKTAAGSKHDIVLYKESNVARHIPKNVRQNVDLGFLGVKKEYPCHLYSMPKKKPKGRELSAVDKKQNKVKSRRRVIVENALAGVKRLRIVSDVFRNIKKNFDDQVMFLACGLWNYHLSSSCA
jgi:hypothetical protein